MISATINITRQYGSLWIVLPDSINVENCKTFENEIEKSCNGNIGRVVLDFAKVTNLYSSGLGLMIRLKKFVQQRNGDLCIVNISSRLHGMLAALNLDKVFSIFATDVEFEVSQKDVWEHAKKAVKAGFIFVSLIEGDSYRINISGEMIISHDTSSCANFQPVPHIRLYIFDLSSLEQIDSSGAYQFLKMTSRIAQSGAVCRAFGVEEFIHETLTLLDAARFVTFYKDEQDALNGTDPVK